MPSPTKRSAAERSMYRNQQDVISRNQNTEKVLTLIAPDRIRDHPQKYLVWQGLCNDLSSRSLLSPSYYQSLVILTDNIVAYEQLQGELAETGSLIPTLGRDGNTIIGYKENPLFSMVKRTELLINKLCEKFGLNPRDAVYTANPDIQQKAIEAQASSGPKQGKIEYFAK